MKTPLSFDAPDECIVDADGKIVCDLGPSGFLWEQDREHAREIVAACNAHARLVEALGRIARGEHWATEIAEEALAAIPK